MTGHARRRPPETSPQSTRVGNYLKTKGPEQEQFWSQFLGSLTPTYLSGGRPSTLGPGPGWLLYEQKSPGQVTNPDAVWLWRVWSRVSGKQWYGVVRQVNKGSTFPRQTRPWRPWTRSLRRPSTGPVRDYRPRSGRQGFRTRVCDEVVSEVVRDSSPLFETGVGNTH